MANQECGTGEVKRENTGGKPAAATGADRQRQQARPTRRHGAGAAMRRGKPLVAKPAAMTLGIN